MQKKKIESISGLKGISCLIIMLYHYRFFLLDNGLEIIAYGHYFVEVFVMISGFLMAYNYRNRIYGLKFFDFFINKYTKVMPLYWITEICAYVAKILAVVLAGEKYEKNLIELLLEFSGIYTGWFGQAATPMNAPLWTVCSLLICYILFYLICKISKKNNFIYIGLILILIFACMFFVINMICKGKYYYIFGSEDSLWCIISFLIGLLLYELYDKIPNCLGEVISYILFSAFGGFVYCFSKSLVTIEIDVKILTSLMVILIFSPCVLYMTIYVRIFKYIFRCRILQFMGEISMDIYMWHWVVRMYLGSRPFYVNQDTWSGWILLIIVSLAVSIVSHYIIVPEMYKMITKIKVVVCQKNIHGL